ncbi:hypothetical protein HDU98_007992 [Podochytrium sp. JEL0797]|nr:hypothetical protein HDU98_007992 [Podochytrium sp. JEL0797]
MTSYYSIDLRYANPQCLSTDTAVLVYNPSPTCTPNTSCTTDQYGIHNTACTPSSTNLTAYTSQSMSTPNTRIAAVSFYSDAGCTLFDHVTHYKIGACVDSYYINPVVGSTDSFSAYRLSVVGGQVVNTRFTDSKCGVQNDEWNYGPTSGECVRGPDSGFVSISVFATSGGGGGVLASSGNGVVVSPSLGVVTGSSGVVGGGGGGDSGDTTRGGGGGGGSNTGVIVGCVLAVLVLAVVAVVFWFRKRGGGKQRNRVSFVPHVDWTTRGVEDSATRRDYFVDMEIPNPGLGLELVRSETEATGVEVEHCVGVDGVTGGETGAGVREEVGGVGKLESTALGVVENQLFVGVEEAVAVGLVVAESESFVGGSLMKKGVKKGPEEESHSDAESPEGLVTPSPASVVGNMDEMISMLHDLKVDVNPISWTIAESVKWVLRNGGDAVTEGLMKDHEIDGQVLMTLAPDVLMDVLEIRVIGRRVKFSNGVDALKALALQQQQQLPSNDTVAVEGGTLTLPPAYGEI